MGQQWVVLIYKIPSEPSAGRVAVWRKLRRLGAVLLHDAAWVLPANARTREQFQWLAADIHDFGGEAFVLEGAPLLPGQDETLAQHFHALVEPAYRELLALLQQPDADLGALARRYQQVLAQDHCGSPLAGQVRAALLSAQGGEAL
jgi:hypothetical protein